MTTVRSACRRRRGGCRWPRRAGRTPSRQSTPELLAWFDAGDVDAAEAQVADDRAGLLRQPGLVEAAHDVAVEHRRRAEHLADGDHAGAADAREADREVVGGHDGDRVGQPGDAGRRRARPASRARASAVGVDGDGGERRAVALQARQVEVAARLVDARLAPVRRVDRLHRQAVALVAAVAAALAHPLVDDDAEARAWRACPGCGRGASRPRTRWSWSSTVTPGHLRRARPGVSISRVRSRTSTRRSASGPKSACVPLAGLVGRDDDPRRRPRAAATARPRARSSGPAGPGRRSSRRCRCRAACR